MPTIKPGDTVFFDGAYKGRVVGIIPAFADPDGVYRVLLDVPFGLKRFKVAVALNLIGGIHADD